MGNRVAALNTVSFLHWRNYIQILPASLFAENLMIIVRSS